MVEYYKPTSNEFKDGARREFSFLLSEFNFKEGVSPFNYSNQYSVCFSNPLSYVYVEGLSYGYALGVDIGRLSPSGQAQERISLSHLVGFRRPDLVRPTYPERRGQLEDMKEAALFLKECAGDFLAGDFTALPQVLRYKTELEENSRLAYENAELERAATKASEAFHTGSYSEVVKLLQPFAERLSKSQQMLLSLSIKKLDAQYD